jgi:hypothetical protein
MEITVIALSGSVLVRVRVAGATHSRELSPAEANYLGGQLINASQQAVSLMISGAGLGAGQKPTGTR